MQMLHVLLGGAIVVAGQVALSPAPAQAQSSFIGELSEIVVTARKREEALSDTPVAVSAISGLAIEMRQLDTIAHIGEFVPNMTFQTGAPTGAGLTTPSIFIRGVGSSETSLGTEPGVGLYVDDVYISRSVGSVLDLVDIQSVQVLRGPQGTMFGRNSVGGAILIQTERPGEEFGGFAEVKTGDDDRFDLKASVNVPLSDSLRMRLSGMTANRDGFVKNSEGKDLGDTDRIGGRAVIEWQATDDLRLTLSGDGMRARESSVPAVVVGFVSTIPGTNIPSQIQAVANLKGTCGGAPVTGISGNSDCIDMGAVRGPFRVADNFVMDNEIFDSQGSRPYGNTTNVDILGTSLKAEWDFAENFTLKSITAYRELEAFWVSNSDHTPNPGIETKNDLDHWQFTQELQVLGETGALDWVAGAFYMKEKGENLNVVAFPPVIFRSGGGFKTESVAAFAQGTYNVTDELEVTLGLRYTYERKNFDTLQHQQTIGVLLDPVNRIFLDLRDNPVPFVTGDTPRITENEITPHASVAYHWTPEVMTYLSYSKGYKSGGYEQRLAPESQEVPSFAPEYVHSFEAGVKAAIANNLQAGLAVFYMDYNGLQISVVDGPSPTLTNAGDATMKGAELEATWRATPELTFNVFGSYLDAEYDNLSQRALNSGVRLDNRLPNASKWQLGASGSYLLDLGDFTLLPFVEWAYRSGLYMEPSNMPLLYQGGYHLLNAALTLAPANERWSLSLSGRNLLDETYLVTGMAQAAIGQIAGQYARPREWNLALRVNF